MVFVCVCVLLNKALLLVCMKCNEGECYVYLLQDSYCIMKQLPNCSILLGQHLTMIATGDFQSPIHVFI